jgi:hypothetical protein
MALRPQVAQAELIQFNRDLFRAEGSFSLASYGTGCFVLPAKWNALGIVMKGSLQLCYFWLQLGKVGVGKTVIITPAYDCKMKNGHVTHAHCEMKKGHGNSRPLRNEKWPW